MVGRREKSQYMPSKRTKAAAVVAKSGPTNGTFLTTISKNAAMTIASAVLGCLLTMSTTSSSILCPSSNVAEPSFIKYLRSFSRSFFAFCEMSKLFTAFFISFRSHRGGEFQKNVLHLFWRHFARTFQLKSVSLIVGNGDFHARVWSNAVAQYLAYCSRHRFLIRLTEEYLPARIWTQVKYARKCARTMRASKTHSSLFKVIDCGRCTGRLCSTKEGRVDEPKLSCPTSRDGGWTRVSNQLEAGRNGYSLKSEDTCLVPVFSHHFRLKTLLPRINRCARLPVCRF